MPRVPVLLLIALTKAIAFDPMLNTVLPRGGQLGTEVEVQLPGQRLFEPQEIIFYQPGITVVNLEKVDDNRAKAVLRIAPDAPLGEHALRLRTKEGVTYMRTFWVTRFPDVKEEVVRNEKRNRDEERNDTFDEPQRVELNRTIHGISRREDADYYVFRGKKGQRVTAELFGIRLGRTMFDPYLALLDSRRFELATSDDTVLTKRDPFVSVVLPEDGDYTLLVRESSYEGNDESDYLLQLAEVPRPTVVWPPAAHPGETAEFTFIGDAAGPFQQTLALPSGGGVDEAYAETGGQKAPSPNPIRLTGLAIQREQEPNTRGDAVKQPAQALPAAFQGVLEKPGDEDWFKFSAKKDERLRALVHARDLRSPLDSVIQIRAVKQNKDLGNNDDDGNFPDSKLDFVIPEDGEYLLHVRDQLRRGGPEFVYHVEISAVAPTLSAELPYAENNNSQKEKVIVIPRGNHLAVVPNVNRQSTGCDVILQAGDLPPGVSFHAEPAPRDPVNFPILFSAAGDAPLGATLASLSVKDTGSDLSGPFFETINHVEINNAGAFASTTTERLVVAVVEKAPYHLELVAPAVPIVQDGSMNLIVRATRDEGFDKEIKVKIPWRPAGIGAPPEVTIPGDQTEAAIPINADGGAPVRSWQLTVTGEADAGRGQMRVSTPFAKLDVAEPYVKASIDLATGIPGQTVEVPCHFEHLKPFEGEAELTIQGLPHGVSAPPLKLTAGQESTTIPLTISEEAKPGKSNAIFAQILVPLNGTAMPHQVARGTTVVITPPPKDETAAKE